MTPLGTFLQSNLDASIQDRKLHHRCRIYYTSQLIIIVFEYYNTYCYYLKCYPQKTTTCEIIQRSNFTFFSRAICKKNRIWFFCVYVCLPPPNRQSSSDHSRHFWVISRQKACHHFLVPSTRTEKILLHILTVSLEAAMLSGFVWQPQMAIHVWSVATNVRWRFVSAQLSNKFD